MNAMASERALETQEGVASLPMYDFPELREAHEALWRGLQRALVDLGFARAPATLLRGDAADRAWDDPRLLLTQTCGYPLALGLRGYARLVATPSYRARGCQGPYHRSVVLVRQSDPAMSLAETRLRRVAVNALESNTGANLLRAMVADLAGARPFFGEMIKTGAHAQSAAAVLEGLADVAAVDCVTWAHLERFMPERCRRLRVLAWSGPSPSLPFVTGPLTRGFERKLLRRALNAVIGDGELKEARSALLLDGLHDLAAGEYAALARICDNAPELA